MRAREGDSRAGGVAGAPARSNRGGEKRFAKRFAGRLAGRFAVAEGNHGCGWPLRDGPVWVMGRLMPNRAAASDRNSVIPRHVAVIMDGNGRWARERGLPRTEGHRRGADAVQRTVEACVELGVEFLTLYAFSSENWKRPKTEVDALMKLLDRFLRTKLDEMLKKDVRFQAIGRLTDLPAACQESLHRAIERTADNTGLTLILALSYGGREEIVDGVKSVLRHVQEGHLDPAMITPEVFSRHLYTRYWPDPDLLIRTSGELRLSNFLLWQLSYAEFWVTPKLWPDFDRADLKEALAAYGRRERRFGGL